MAEFEAEIACGRGGVESERAADGGMRDRAGSGRLRGWQWARRSAQGVGRHSSGLRLTLVIARREETARMGTLMSDV